MNISAMNSIQHAQWRHNSESTAPKQIASRQTSKNARKQTRQIVIALAGALALIPTARAGLPPDIEVFNNMQEVSDADLGHMRGKFAANNQVMYFGVEMVSQWQTPTGSFVTAGANLDIDFSSGSPTVHYAPTVTIVQGQATTDPASNTSVSGGGGLANISGVSQSIQVAGRTNNIRNDINMQVDEFSGSQGGYIATATQGSAGSISQTGSDGTVATVTLGHNSIGLNVDVPGQGQVLQQIRDQGLMQAVRIGGDLNQIHNQITMHIGLSMATGLSGTGITTALQSLRGIPNL